MAQITHFDGYLSNKKELAKEFGEKEDKELALSVYEKYGEDFAKYLEGMFGIIIKDESKTVLARDRFGNESVYYYLTGNEIVCGLTMNEILNSGKYEKEINHEALELFLTYSYLPGKKTFFSDIMKVMPGHVMTFEDGKLSDKQYFKIEYERDDSKSLDEYAKEINDTLNELVDD
ncbi:MAG: hypothetical protein MJ246_04540 [Clostridia bacterium]|nr:hypothetical protein [Clostridia bacterium]